MTEVSVTQSNPKLIRLKSMLQKTGLSRSNAYYLISIGKLPKPVKLSEKSVAWVESEINTWIQQRIEARGDEL